MVTISRAPLEKLEAYKKRMGWGFKWVSSFANDFNRDYHVSFTPEAQEKGEVYYNYKVGRPFSPEAPGISVFYKDEKGNNFHTYSCYAGGLDMLNGAYHSLDLVPKGPTKPGCPPHKRGSVVTIRPGMIVSLGKEQTVSLLFLPSASNQRSVVCRRGAN